MGMLKVLKRIEQNCSFSESDTRMLNAHRYVRGQTQVVVFSKSIERCRHTTYDFRLIFDIACSSLTIVNTICFQLYFLEKKKRQRLLYILYIGIICDFIEKNFKNVLFKKN